MPLRAPLQRPDRFPIFDASLRRPLIRAIDDPRSAKPIAAWRAMYFDPTEPTQRGNAEHTDKPKSEHRKTDDQIVFHLFDHAPLERATLREASLALPPEARPELLSAVLHHPRYREPASHEPVTGMLARDVAEALFDPFLDLGLAS